eukprot:scaffold6279_cov418-Prasinococcus_capsulatus_cf.AAC.8
MRGERVPILSRHSDKGPTRKDRRVWCRTSPYLAVGAAPAVPSSNWLSGWACQAVLLVRDEDSIPILGRFLWRPCLVEESLTRDLTGVTLRGAGVTLVSCLQDHMLFQKFIV